MQMKTIFRYTQKGLLMAALFAVGALTGVAQDPCADAEGLKAADERFRAAFLIKTPEARKGWIETGRAFSEKYGACEAGKDLGVYLTTQIPKWEAALKTARDGAEKAALLKRFDLAMTAKNWDEVYASGKEILKRYPGDEFRDVVLVLGSIGLDETAKAPRVTKWNEDTITYAKQAVQDLEAGKSFKTYGVSIKNGANFQYKNKDDALGWMNYTLGYIYFFDKANKKEALSYLYKATQLASDTKSNPIVFQSIGSYYYDEVRKLALEVDALAKQQADTDTPEISKQKIDAIKVKVAMVNGTTEAAIDAYARALSLAKTDSAKYKKEYTDSLDKTLKELYNVRFGKMEGFDAFIANTVKKPLPNPMDPVKPISDPEPATTTTTSTAPVPPAKPAATPTKPAASAAVKPGTPTKK